MRDRGIIYVGLALFLGFVTMPLWRNLARAVTTRGPRPVLPASVKRCVEPVEFMRTSHMTLLLDWRDRVVRQGARDFTASDGQHYNMSLTATCLGQCHGGARDRFCDGCHDYAAVSVPCWDCHTGSRTAFGGVR
jgi:hypothetical protein